MADAPTSSINAATGIITYAEASIASGVATTMTSSSSAAHMAGPRSVAAGVDSATIGTSSRVPTSGRVHFELSGF